MADNIYTHKKSPSHVFHHLLFSWWTIDFVFDHGLKLLAELAHSSSIFLCVAIVVVLFYYSPRMGSRKSQTMHSTHLLQYQTPHTYNNTQKCFISFNYLFEEVKTAPTLTPFPNHSVGTPTLQPLASLIQRTNTGFAFGISISPSLPSSIMVGTPPPEIMVVFLITWEEDVGVPPAVLGVGSKGGILPRRLGACFLRSRFIVSIWFGGLDLIDSRALGGGRSEKAEVEKMREGELWDYYGWGRGGE